MKYTWIEKFAEAAVPIIRKSIGTSKTVAEITQGHGMFSNDFLSCLNDSVELFRTDSPMQDYTAFSMSPSSVPLKSTRWVPGSIFSQLYPSNSMDFIYVLQAFNQSSKPLTTMDHLIPSLSENELTKKLISKHQESDLNLLLLLRHQELKPSKSLVFDLILSPPPSETPYSWDCLDLAVRKSRKTLPESFQEKLNFQTNFRDLDQITKIFKKLENLYSLEDLIEKTIPFPAYENFCKSKNLEDYLFALGQFWGRPVWLMSRRQFKEDVRIRDFYSKVMETFTNICRDVKPVTVQRLLTVRLKKI
jgi:hypothetical protein